MYTENRCRDHVFEFRAHEQPTRGHVFHFHDTSAHFDDKRFKRRGQIEKSLNSHKELQALWGIIGCFPFSQVNLFLLGYGSLGDRLRC